VSTPGLPPAHELELVSAGCQLPGYHREMSLAAFVLRYLPPAPARVLEIGCGPVGDLTYAIAAAGYEIVAVGLYTSLGFQPTGEIEDDEPLLRLRLANRRSDRDE
jgi:hypothetical protein